MQLLKFAIIWFSLTIMPGPDMIFVITESIKNGARNGIKIAMGLCSGLAFHSLVVLTGFGLVVSKFPAITNTIKYIGAAYLIYIGVKSFLSTFKRKNNESENTEGSSAQNKIESKNLEYNPYTRGIIMNITNPKLLIFFLSFLPQFVNLEQNTWVDSILIFLLLVGIALPTFSIVAIFSSKISRYFKRSGQVGANTQKFLAFLELSIYLFIAGGIIFSK
ncbi:MAG: LysE family translocator [Rikenellaceae bacterium]